MFQSSGELTKLKNLEEVREIHSALSFVLYEEEWEFFYEGGGAGSDTEALGGDTEISA